MEAMKNPPTSGPLEKWRLFFKLFCFIKPQNVPNESIEAAFMFEQVGMCEQTVLTNLFNGHLIFSNLIGP